MNFSAHFYSDELCILKQCSKLTNIISQSTNKLSLKLYTLRLVDFPAGLQNAVIYMHSVATGNKALISTF